MTEVFPMQFDDALRAAIRSSKSDNQPSYILRKAWAYTSTRLRPSRSIEHYVVHAHLDGSWSCTHKCWDGIQNKMRSKLIYCELGAEIKKLIDEVVDGNA